MKDRIFRKLKNKKGSSLPEALIGFLMATMTSMILVGVVSTSANIMTNGDSALAVVYEEQKAFDVFIHHQYDAYGTGGTENFKDLAGSSCNTVNWNWRENDSGTNRRTTVTLKDTGIPGENTPNNELFGEVKPLVGYLRALKHNVFCFATPPDSIVK